MNTNTTITARFWVWEDRTAIKLSLKDGQEVEFYVKHRTDEGWRAEGARYWREGNHVFQEWHYAARDCDGVFENGGTLVCHLSQLKARKWSKDHDELLPEWEQEEEWRRDHEAERMGY